MREAPSGHRTERGVVSEPGGCARLDDERAAGGAKASVRLHLPERSTAGLADGTKGFVVVGGIVTGDLVCRPVGDREPRGVSQVERGSPRGARAAANTETPADAGGAFPDALEECPGPPALHHALSDGEGDDPALGLAKAGAPERRHQSSERKGEHARRRQCLARQTRGSVGRGIRNQDLGVDALAGNLEGRQTFLNGSGGIQAADDHAELEHHRR